MQLIGWVSFSFEFRNLRRSYRLSIAGSTALRRGLSIIDKMRRAKVSARASSQRAALVSRLEVTPSEDQVNR